MFPSVFVDIQILYCTAQRVATQAVHQVSGFLAGNIRVRVRIG